jgi:hypothetical protein
VKRRPSIACRGVRVTYTPGPGIEQKAYRVAERFREMLREEGLLFNAGLSVKWEGL